VCSSSHAEDSEREEEYEGEEQLATVTVVEDFDPATLIYGSPVPARHATILEKDGTQRKMNQTTETVVTRAKIAPAKAAQAKASNRAKEVKYQTTAARRAEKRKQLARHTEKAERAGGKQQRKRSKGRR
jgi:ribosomal RNA-processing protein 17